MTSEENKQNIIRAYKEIFPLAYLILRLWKHAGIHYGFYDRPDQKRDDAVLNMNRVLAKRAKIEPGMKVLDAGCGIGGSAVWLAKNCNASVAGITLVEQQSLAARKLAKEHGVSRQTEFFVRDFCNTGFPNDSFDVVWAIESVCYAENKHDFLVEAKRVLKPGGCLIVADGFLKKRGLSGEEKQMMDMWLGGWVVPHLADIASFVIGMRTLGFQDILYNDISGNVLPFSSWAYKIGRIFYPLARTAERLKIHSKTVTRSFLSAIWAHRTLQEGLWAYMICQGEKSA